MRFLRDVKRKNQAKKNNQGSLKYQEDENWKLKCDQLDRKFDSNKKHIEDH